MKPPIVQCLLSSQIAITKKYFYIEKMSTSAAASVAVFEYDREAIRVKARLISMTKGLAHDMFSRIFRIRMYKYFLTNIL